MRGLKSCGLHAGHDAVPSHPIRDAWIEIVRCEFGELGDDGRIPYGMRGLKLEKPHFLGITRWSHPIRDAWIEIRDAVDRKPRLRVASHTGCVD